ncbi:MAG: aspartate 1-decarboxylase [Planctomycetes bacterium]|nr:aspartate 1-decarboxylase [Planctomycetota bacterium]
MIREILIGKLHRVMVTDVKPEYPGSLTVDIDWLERAGILPYEKVQVLNCNNGYRLETYAIVGERGKGELIVNGAAARHALPGDLVIVCAFGQFALEEAKLHKPKVVLFDERNRVVGMH